MASAGTLLSELDSRGPSTSQDNDLVEKILMDMNAGSGGNSVQMPAKGMSAPPPPLPAQVPPGVVPMNTTFNQAADPMVAQAHVIGREHPTPGDFAAAIHGVDRTMGSPLMPRQQQQEEYEYEEPKKNIYARVLDEVKTPLVVALLFFVFSLPAINVLVAHYLPSMILPTGSLTMVGLLGKSVLVGAAFWILQRVVAPLLKA